uniref:Uncharacterized protein n=1 Tax=viral metagenome TaxID=1070528 RepID=A0A6C0B0S5_9ZZZZ
MYFRKPTHHTMNFVSISDSDSSSYCDHESMFYEHNGIKYIYTFPKEWASCHTQGSGPVDCKSCKDWGMWNGIFLGYCNKCAHDPYTYNGNRGSGFDYPGQLVDPFDAESIYYIDNERSVFVSENNNYLSPIVFEDIPTTGTWITTPELLALDKNRGAIMEKTGKIFFMTPSEHGQNHTCSHTTPFAEFVIYHLGYIEKCLEEDYKIAADLPSTWREQRIPGVDDSLSKEEEDLYYERVDYIIRTYDYMQGNYDVNYIFQLLKEMPVREPLEKDVQADALIAQAIKAKCEEEEYYATINAYVDERADCPSEWPVYGEYTYGCHFDEGYDSF